MTTPSKTVNVNVALKQTKSLAKKGQLDKSKQLYHRVLEALQKGPVNKKHPPGPPQAQIDAAITLYSQGQAQEALKTSEMLIKDYPSAPLLYNISGTCYQALGQLDAAVKSYNKALAINPDYAEAHYNLGNTLKELGQLEAAVKSYELALAIKPDYAEAHSKLGNILQELGQIEKAVKCYEQALTIKPDYAKTWNDVFYTAKALDLSNTKNTWIKIYKKNLGATALKNIYFRTLEYRLKACSPHTVDNCYNDLINSLPLISHEEIHNPLPIHQKKISSFSNNIIALTFFGRSGTLLLHSLIDNHPEISTLPSIYFRDYYNADTWRGLIAQGWDQLPENFIKQFAVLFDARAPIQISDNTHRNIGQIHGMANVGVNRDEVLTVDQNRFCAELRKLMAGYTSLTPQSFFTLVHSAYEKALNRTSKKETIFYHIHQPNPYAKLNFLRYNPEARLLMMVREPIQSMEAMIKMITLTPYCNANVSISSCIVTMLFDIDQIAFRRQDSIGVRLEDLKRHPKETLAALCGWMGIKDSPTLYEMTAQGKKWWGNPNSPDYEKEGMLPFSSSNIKRPVGSIFSEQDQFILRTLFYPFSVRFGYVEENLERFKADLKAIKPLLDEPFGFQEQLAENLNQDLETITRSGPALYFRAALHDRWAVLNEFNDYPYMLKPLSI
jgi:tetratricopeptide (TPR) repeat protein